jgi:hypothetical protein
MASTTRPPRRGNVPPYCPPLLPANLPEAKPGRPLPAAAPPSRPSPPPTCGIRKFGPTPEGRCRLVLEIAGRSYSVLVLRPEPAGEAQTVIRLTKPDRTVYHVAVAAYGPECDCADYEFRHRGNGTICKHLKALEAVGILASAPLPVGPSWPEASDGWNLAPTPEDLDSTPAFLAGAASVAEGGAR